MTKRFLTTLILMYLTVGIYAQVKFTTYQSIDGIFKDLQQNNKILHLLTRVEECQQCMDVALEAMNSVHLSEKYNSEFISVKVMKDDTLYNAFKSQINNFSLAPHIFISKDKIILYKLSKTSSNIVMYLDAALEAQKNLTKADKSIESEANFEKNPTKENLISYIQDARNLKNYDCELMDKYVGLLTVEEKADPKILLFIQQQGCDLYSNSYEVTSHIDAKTKDSLWYSLKNTERVAINNRFRMNSFQKILERRDEAMLEKLVRITINQHNRSNEGYQHTWMMMLDYYEKTNNDEKFLDLQNAYVKRWLNYSIDSLNNLDISERDKAMKSGNLRSGFRFLPKSVFVSSQLNNAAFKVCEKTNNRGNLNTALDWIKKAIEITEKCQLFKNPGLDAYYDTYAHLLYKLDRYDEALDWQAKAVSYNVLSDFKDPKYSEKYEKMKSKKL